VDRGRELLRSCVRMVRDWRLLSKLEDGVRLEELACELERRSCQPPRLTGAHQRQVSSSLAS
jgi:hypothetical protein